MADVNFKASLSLCPDVICAAVMSAGALGLITVCYCACRRLFVLWVCVQILHARKQNIQRHALIDKT